MKFNPNLKKFFLFISSLFLGFIILVVLFQLPPKSQTTSSLASPIPITTLFSKDSPPSESLKGELSSLNGTVSWQSRVATESSPISKPQIIQQGESLETGEKGSAKIDFDQVGSIILNPKSKISFAQTLPINLVLALSSGSAKFTRTGIVPISIRSLHLLTQIDSGGSTITTDTDNHLVTVFINSGSSTLAWTDLDNNTQVVNLPTNKKFIFDDDKRKRVY